MRASVMVAVACFLFVGVSAADAVKASVRKPISIPAQSLVPALQALARDRDLQMVYESGTIDSLHTRGASGDLTAEEALAQLLDATGFTYKFYDANAVSIVPAAAAVFSSKEGAGAKAAVAPRSEHRDDEQRVPRHPADRLHLAQATPAAPSADSSSRAQTGGVQSSQAPGAQPEEPVVIVTGTHIPQTGMSTPTPVTVLSADQLQETKPGPVIEALNTVPQFINNSTPGNGVNFSTNSGQSFLNMRGLGINRTLVLLDGRRVTPSSRLGAPDISLFPQALISRVEVVTGGASAVYGSDAVAGVANFILDTKFTGLDVRALGGITSRGDNTTYGASATFGTSWGERFHLIGSAEFHSAKAVENLRNRQDWFGSVGIVTNPQWIANGTGPRLLTLPDVTSTRYTEGGLINQPGSALNRMMFLPDGTVTPFVAGPVAAIGTGTFSQSGGIGYHRLLDGGAGAGGLYPNLERQTAFLHADYQVSDNLSLFAEVMYGHSMTNYNQGGGAMFSQWQLRIFRENAFLPANVRQVMTNEGLNSFSLSRMASKADVGRSRNQTSNSLFSPAIGLKAEIGGWKINADYQDGQNQSNSFLINYIRSDHLAMAVDAVVNPANGSVVCYSTLFNPTNGCVPANLFGAGNASPQAISYILGNKLGFATVKQRFGEVTASKEIFQGWGAGPVSLAIGASTRHQSLAQHASPEDGTQFVPFDNPAQGIRGVPAGFAGNPFVFVFSSFPTIGGSYSVHEGFAESLVPLIKDVPGIEQLNLSLAGRFADYSGSGGVWAWKGGLDWQIVPSVRLRGTVSRDTRAANLAERFDSQGGGVVVRDPQFNNTNVTLSQFSTGNPNVDPERATTLTAGAVFTPTFVPGLRVSLDYYKIDNKDAIDQLGSQAIVDNCFAGSAGFCSLITRDPITHQLVFVQNKFLNVSEEKVSGIDAEADYVHEVSWLGGAPEQISVRLMASYLEKNSIGQDTGNSTGSGRSLGLPNYAGQVGNGFSLPRFQSVGQLAYSRGALRAMIEERFIGEGKVDHAYHTGVDIDDNSVGAAAYTDLDVSYTQDREGTGSITFYGHITNAFDRAPPIVPGFSDFNGASQYNQTVYDVLGRRFTLGMRMRF
jgi:outer membrane receptor protein involved in Fe transport